MLINFEKPKIKNIIKKKLLEISSFYTCVLKTSIIWGTVPEIQRMKKLKAPGDTIILHNCTKNNDHWLYCSWDMACDGCNCYFSILGYFLPPPPLTVWKMKIPKKLKKHLEIWFYTSVPKIMILCYTIPKIWHVTHVMFIFHFGLFFALLPP